MDRNRRWSIVAYALTIWSAAVCTGDRSGRLRMTRSAGVLLDPKCLSRALLTVVVNSAVTSIAPTATKAVSMRFRLGQGAGTCSQRHDSGLGCSSLHGFTSRKGSSRLQALSVCPRPMCQRRGWRLMSLRLTQRLRSHRVHATSQTSWTWRPWLAAVASCCLAFTLANTASGVPSWALLSTRFSVCICLICRFVTPCLHTMNMLANVFMV